MKRETYHSSHFVIVAQVTPTFNDPSPLVLARNNKAMTKPAKHQMAMKVSLVKSRIMAWRAMKTMLSGIKVNAIRVSSTGAAVHRTGRAK